MSNSAFSELIATQSRIGWDHFFRGKWSHDWRILQYFYAKRFKLLKESEGWAIKLIQLLSNAAFDAWEERNHGRHGYDSATRKQKALEQTQKEVRLLYSLRNQVLSDDQNLFQTSLSTHLNQPLHRLQSWVTANKLLILHSAKQAKAQAIVGTKHLKVYFTATGNTVSKVLPRPQTKKKKKLRVSHLTKHFVVIGSNRSSMQDIPEEPIPLGDDNPDRTRPRQTPRNYQQLILSCLFPDHPT